MAATEIAPVRTAGRGAGATLADMDATVLERDGELAALAGAVQDAAAGAGWVVLVSGEAGIGKSTLVNTALAMVPPRVRVLVGHCDDLGTARVLGPLRDLADRVSPALAAALERGDSGAVMHELRAELAQDGALDRQRPHGIGEGPAQVGALDPRQGRALGGGPAATLLVIEDVHWADEATLDVLRFLVRRVESLPVVLVLTFRDDALPADHPLRQVLGLAARSGRVRRLRLARLSPAAVRELSRSSSVDPDRVFGVTSGNPFFVMEVLAEGDADAVPLTIADAVGARLARLDQPTRSLIERLAVVPGAVEPWLVEVLDATGPDRVAQAEEQGLLTAYPTRIAFRHELTRRAIVDAMPSARRVAAHREVLAALSARPDADVSRLVHHAVRGGDREAVLRFGPQAADQARAAGAHRQAAAHLREVLAHQPQLPPGEEARLWQQLSIEDYTIDAPSAPARAAIERAVALCRQVGDEVALGQALRWLSRICWWAGDILGARVAGDEAVAVLDGTGHPAELAMILSNQAQLHALAGQAALAVEAGERALELGGHVPAIRSHALNNVGLALARVDDPRWREMFEESLATALAADDPEQACRAYVNRVWCELERLDIEAAATRLAAGIELAERTEFVTFSRYLQLILGMVHLARGEWDEVVPSAAYALDGSPPIRGTALTVVGRLRARRGEPGALDLLREAWELAVRADECQRIGPAAAALAEAAALADDPSLAERELRIASELAHRVGSTAVRAELDYWLVRLGLPVAEGLLAATAHPYAALAVGDWRAAAARWSAAGWRYEAALALASSRDAEELLAALAEFDALGAEPMAARVRASLRRLGVVRIPRGPATMTRVNPAGLTQRQLEIAHLLVEGLTNAEIAGQLVLSVRTVDSHVAAVFDKLGVRSRKEAAARLGELGVGGVAG